MAISPTLDYFLLQNRGGKRMAYWSWGDTSAAHLVLCVHGLTRQGRDFDVLAQAILDKASSSGESTRVVCVDIIGRGVSDWLDDPAGYTYPDYTQDMAAFLAALHGEHPFTSFDWIGTSMGGLIGMCVLGAHGMGALSLPIAPRCFVINDVGPTLEWAAVSRIGQYVGQHKPDVGIFASEQEAADVMWQLASSFGPHSKAEWLELSRHQCVRCSDGKYTFAYDPAIANIFKQITQKSNEQAQAVTWQLYENITAKTLVTRGLVSDLLSSETAIAMTNRGYKMPVPARLVEFAGVGHAPTFVAKDQHDVVVNFLWSK
jgi:pimeloyl-ACP methyl ester carboxylesterase